MTLVRIRRAVYRGILPLVLLTLAGPARAATPQQVEQAIAKAQGYLFSQQKNGNWEVVPRPDLGNNSHYLVTGWQWGGLSSVATCALLASGQSSQETRMKQAISFLKDNETPGIYALGFKCQVWAMLPRSEVRQAVKRDAGLILSAYHKNGVGTGLFPYYGGQGDWYDHSVSQYGVLGLWACSQVDLEIPLGHWRAFDGAWRSHQYPSGAWSYRFKGDDDKAKYTEETLAMTAAGVATLFITQEFVDPSAGINCQGGHRDENIERGLKWVSEHFAAVDRAEGRHGYYSLYGIERIGVASGYKYFGNLNWYEHGADILIKSQNADGSWGESSDNDNAKKVPDTCFGLLFLVRGRAPVMMNKLEYAVDAHGDRAKPPTWNQRPRDAANITRWTGKQIERDLNWQIVNLKAPVEELHDAPILYISGKEAIVLSEPEEQKLKAFCEQGGLIVANADCASKPFADSIRKLGTKLFGYEFRELPEAHPIYAGQQFRRAGWRTPPSVLGLSNDVREMMILIPTGDAAKGWQTQSFSGPDREPLAQLMADIFQYAVDKKNLRVKGETYIVAADTKVTAQRTVKVARLWYAGNWNPEPYGWTRLGNVLHNTRQTDLAVETVKLGEGKLTGDYKVAHLTGTIRFKLNDAQRGELRKFVDGGGTLIIDAAGGSSEFNAAAEAELASLFPESKGKYPVLPLAHGVYGAGEKIAEVNYRAFSRRVLGSNRVPRLRGIDVKGRTAVFVSGEDLSGGLVGQAIDGIHGYTPETATSLMANLITYAVEPPPTTTAPSTAPGAATLPAK